MIDYEVIPHVGVGPVRLGMSRGEVRRLMPESPHPFRKVPWAEHETDAFHGSAFQVFYAGETPIVEYIQLSRGQEVRAFFRGMDVFAVPADEVVARVCEEAPFDPNDKELGFSYIFRPLELSLWRPVVPESTADPDGRYFSAISIGIKGYYDKDSLEAEAQRAREYYMKERRIAEFSL